MTRGGVSAIVLAAGAGQRFGRPKQLALLRGRPLLEHALEAASASTAEETVVVLGAHAEEVEFGVDLGGAKVVRCADWTRGQLASLRAGIAAVSLKASAAIVTLGDEPFLPPRACERLVAGRRPGRCPLRASYHRRPGHPVLIPCALFAAIQNAHPAGSPAALLHEAGLETIECGDLGNPADVDTQTQLARLGQPIEPRFSLTVAAPHDFGLLARAGPFDHQRTGV
jgi:CTP:molybdopterin cytidylyltransferase MocA